MLVSTIQEVEMLFSLKLEKPQAFRSKKIQDSNPVEEWHLEVGHPSAEGYYSLSQATGSVPKFDRTLLQELQCILRNLAKQNRGPLRKSTRVTSKPLELIHLNISGKVRPSLSGAINAVALLNDFTAISCISLLKNKSDLLQALKTYQNRAEVIHKRFGLVIPNICLDRTGEKSSYYVQNFCMLNGIRLEPSPAYTLQSNGAAERLIQENCTRTKTLLFASNLSHELLGEAMRYSN